MTPPNHWAYVQFPGALLIIFALMFVAIARDPAGNRNLIVYGILLKLSYCGIASWYWFTAGIPGLWKPFAVIDLAMAGLFVWSFRALGEGSGGASHRTDRQELVPPGCVPVAFLVTLPRGTRSGSPRTPPRPPRKALTLLGSRLP